MHDQDNNKRQAAQVRPEWSRRNFLGMLGASAAAMLAADSTAAADNTFPSYQDSFGTVAPAAGDTLNVGVYPPPLYNGTGVTPGYTQPNILMIVVDQLRSPRWLPAGGQAAIDQHLPNIAFLRDHSFSFPNYFVAATDCTPSRATLLTGLYSQQNYIFQTQTAAVDPILNAGFPTFGTALSQKANYTTCWIGKWHLSDAFQNNSGPGVGAYGFTADSANMPKDSSLCSPNGYQNEGAMGDNSSPYGNGNLISDSHIAVRYPGYLQFSDGAIANWFVERWLPNALTSQPWFTAVSFVNPHDITAFPRSFIDPNDNNPNFGSLPTQAGSGFDPPPNAGFPLDPSKPDLYVPPLDQTLYSSDPPGWNVGDVPIPYGAGTGKPSLQTWFQGYTDANCGKVLNHAGWYSFLHYYFWMQSCVDYQIGRVLNALAALPAAANTVILFTSDHGDYGGSHGLHTKGCSLYDESINVPLFISFPKMRPPFAPAPTARIRPFVCSSVDIFPFLYTLALGHHNWRNSSDPYTYLSGRECLLDAIFSTAPQQRRLSNIPNANGPGFQPYVLHTTDEAMSVKLGSTPVPSHALAFRTVDTTVQIPFGNAELAYGGGKLGIYTFWKCGDTVPDPAQASGTQYEFYNYTAGNVGETGNSAVSGGNMTTTATSYLNAYNAISASELYIQYQQVQATASQAKADFIGKPTCS